MGKAKDNKWGYILHNGEFAIPPVYDDAFSFHDGKAVVKIDWERFYINMDGERLEDVPEESKRGYEFQSGFNPHYELHDGLRRFVENEKFGYEDEVGNIVIKPQYFEAMDFSEGLACVKKGKTGAWGYIDTNGEVVIPPQFKQAQPFHEGLAAVLTSVE